MIQDVFKLKKKSWHMSLMTWIWGYHHYDFPNMCPYFWLSILNIIILPFVVLGKGFVVLVTALSRWSSEYEESCKEKELLWIKQRIEEMKADPNGKLYKQLLKEKTYFYTHYKPKSRKLSKLIDKLFWLDASLHNEITDKAFDEAQNPKYEKTNRQIIGENTVLMKRIAKFAGIVAAIGVLYLLFLLISWMITLSWGHIFYVIGAAIIKLLVICLIVGLIAGISIGIGTLLKFLYCNYAQYCVPCEERREAIGNFFLVIGRGLAWPFVWLWKGLVTLWSILKALKDDNCPAIDWED